MEASVDGVVCVRADGAAGESIGGEDIEVGVGDMFWEEGPQGGQRGTAKYQRSTGGIR